MRCTRIFLRLKHTGESSQQIQPQAINWQQEPHPSSSQELGFISETIMLLSAKKSSRASLVGGLATRANYTFAQSVHRILFAKLYPFGYNAELQTAADYLFEKAKEVLGPAARRPGFAMPM